MVRGRTMISAGALLLALPLASCGGDDAGGDLADLTKLLMPDAGFYAAADLATIKEDLGLPEDADPLVPGGGEELTFTSLAAPSLALLSQSPDPEITAALNLGAVERAASGMSGSEGVTVLSTGADTGEIGSALGDLGFEDRAGILESGEEGTPAFRLEDRLVFIAEDPASLRELPEEPADDPPAPLLDELDGVSISTFSPGSECTSSMGTSSNSDGSGEIAYLVEGGADASRLELADSADITLGEPEVDGDLITVPVEGGREGVPAVEDARALLLVIYECI